MAGFMDKLKDAAIKAGKAGMKDPRLVRTAQNIKQSVDSFKQGYREQYDPEKHKLVCPHCQNKLRENDKFCSNCGAKVD